jgi:hypothetical protein
VQNATPLQKSWSTFTKVCTCSGTYSRGRGDEL